jgi:O-antigen/teichoic acid export membrane protein
MPKWLSTLRSHPLRAKALEWTRLIAMTGCAQVAVQALGFVSGILIIRLLPVEEYALYTLASTMLGAMLILADGGIATGVMAGGGKVWQDRERLGAVIRTGMELRKKFALVTLAVASPVLIFLLHRSGASPTTALLIVLALIPAFLSGLSVKLLEVAPKLVQDVASIQKIQVAVNGVRLALTGMVLFAFPLAVVAILTSGLAQVWGNWRLRKVVSPHADTSRSEDPQVRADIIATVRQMMPFMIYFCISSQVPIWLLAVFGTPDAVAQVGALTRLGVVIGLLGVVFSTLILPRFARLRGSREFLLRRYLHFQFGLLIMFAVIVCAAWLFQDELLLILGPKYSGLASEVTIMAAGSVMIHLATMSQLIGASQSVITPPQLLVPFLVIIHIIVISSIRIDDAFAALMYAFILHTATFIANVTYYIQHQLRSRTIGSTDTTL